MAEGILFNTIEKLIGKLGSMAVEAWNVGDDVEKLVESMSEIKAVILDAEEQQQGGTNKSHQVKLWLVKLKDALYDADDLLDELSYEDLRRQVITKHNRFYFPKKVRIFFSSSNKVLFSFNMAPKVKDLRKRIEALNVDRKVFNFTNRTPELRVVKLRETHSFIGEEEVIGREKEKKYLIDLLLNNPDINEKQKENVSVISIIGIGGLGKTALAQLVYNDKSVQQHFELKMWVCVADEDSDVKGFDLKGIAAKIAGGSKTDDGIDEVQQKLRKEIEGKRYLLVLDDVWNEKREQWLQLKRLLVGGAKGSKIIITTRSGEVAKISGASSLLFLKGLDEPQSWKLFSQLAFENGKEPENPNFVSMGKEIVEKCVGVPLAIRSIGSLMYSMENEKDWSSFKNKDLVQIDEEGGNTIFQLIKLSYDHLPFHLKNCFAFCSLFPKDYIISKTELIRLWIAQGFVESTNESTSLEECGDKYVTTLINRSFFQDVVKDTQFGDIFSFKMHDLVHDLARHISGNDCVLVNEKGQQHIDKRTHHVSFGFSLNSSRKIPSSLLEVCKLRTLLLPEHTGLSGGSLEESICNSILSCSKQFRALNFNHINSSSIPSCIGTLKHLRYLDLSHSRMIEVLPRSITKLYNLETLLLNHCVMLREFPEDLWKLTSLRHLEFRYCYSLRFMPPGIGQLTNLQTLTKFILDTTSKQKQSAAASELENLNNLRQLNIEGMECLRHSPTEAAKDMNFMGKPHLQELTLNWGAQIDDDNIDEIEKDDIILQGLYLHPNMKVLKICRFGGVAFSNSVNSFTNLSELTLFDCRRLQYLPPILHLKTLTLIALPCLKWIVNDSSNNVNNGSSSTLSPLLLTEIRLDQLDELEGWCRCSEEEMQRGFCNHHLKSLTRLDISRCPNLISLPQHTNVKSLQIKNVKEKVLRQVVNHSNVEDLSLRLIDDLKSFSGVLQHLTELKRLYIRKCVDLDLHNDDEGCCYSMKWKELKNLKELTLNNIPKMESLPEGLQHITTLQSLTIWNCDNLASIPEWVTSLQELYIKNCPKLTSVPEGVQLY